MVSGTEGEPRLDVERAVKLHINIRTTLEEKHTRGVVFFAGESPIDTPSTHRLQRPTLIVAPPVGQLIHRGSALDRFQDTLFPGLQPDYASYSAGSYLDTHGGLYFGRLSFDNIPGFIPYAGQIILSTHLYKQADRNQLTELAKATGKSAIELVRSTTVRVFPSAELAEFFLNYETGLHKGKHPYSPLYEVVSHGLSARKLEVLRENPTGFIAWLEDHMEVAKHYPGVESNLALLEPD